MFATRTGRAPGAHLYPAKKAAVRPERSGHRPALSPPVRWRKPTPEELDAITGDLMDRVRALGEGQS